MKILLAYQRVIWHILLTFRIENASELMILSIFFWNGLGKSDCYKEKFENMVDIMSCS
jgi:hypothetical protein